MVLWTLTNWWSSEQKRKGLISFPDHVALRSGWLSSSLFSYLLCFSSFKRKLMLKNTKITAQVHLLFCPHQSELQSWYHSTFPIISFCPLDEAASKSILAKHFLLVTTDNDHFFCFCSEFNKFSEFSSSSEVFHVHSFSNWGKLASLYRKYRLGLKVIQLNVTFMSSYAREHSRSTHVTGWLSFNIPYHSFC